ncbi:MAG: hypothetical protein UR28_C0002G0010 [Candidatus Peregrinibacteria bacterium GW2011_GWF2_33_10]|nr:MAG: hypothetical protein UR28_C0002G0010 [Candidatus Peregrinibacteria bacterium GW2011_GWF2_33_10]OGJ45594.1 MAG: hypothetical protein A2263_00635 [Candidatus Peregrinibacteria bacterium RIFOXYA2_FULL_33_21]OGJ45972.1 MAG: hypothetical protein A2272_04490 [Candidatus Peregrinibacteria bacterium RIFOXYA12_FULL_33_12]OGJ51077.1 MAG: hypothetical protein A2307_06375 [Candidatus Peregrinibacteria bacterium RIFOXYB2_FULL_33_20]
MSDLNLKSIPDEKDGDKNAFQIRNIEEETETQEPSTKVKIKFGKFVELVAKHSFLEIIENNADQEVVIDSNLLADLANADEPKDLEYPKWAFVVAGVVLGAILVYIILK